jgi:hypothetical protein
MICYTAPHIADWLFFMSSRVVGYLENFIPANIENKFLAFLENKVYYCIDKIPPLDPILSQLSPFQFFVFCF